MADLFGLSPADRDVLMRMIARERANYTSDVRSLAPVPRPRVIYQPSKPIRWFMLTEPLYPQSDDSPYTNSVWSATGLECEWNNETKQWDSVYPEVESTIYATGNMYGMTGMVIPCQPAGDGWEPVASAPGDDVVLRLLPQLDGDITSTLSSQGVQFEETTRTADDKAGFLRFQTSCQRFAYPSSYFQRPIDMNWANPSLDYTTDGEIEVLFTGVYEITFAAQVYAGPRTGSPQGRTLQTTNTTGAASAGTAHTHQFDYRDPWNGYNNSVRFRPAMWRRPVGGSYTEEAGANWLLPEARLNIVGGGGAAQGYYGRIVAPLNAGETLGVKAYSDQLQEAVLEIRRCTLGFHLLQPGWSTVH